MKNNNSIWPVLDGRQYLYQNAVHKTEIGLLA